MKFKELSIGDSFDFINPNACGLNSFFRRCTKTSSRKYVDSEGLDYRVGSINAEVWNVERKDHESNRT